MRILLLIGLKEREDKHMECRLEWQDPISPKMKTTVPRMKLMAIVNSMRSTQKVIKLLRRKGG